MKVEEIKKICPHFNLVTGPDGKPTCSNKLAPKNYHSENDAKDSAVGDALCCHPFFTASGCVVAAGIKYASENHIKEVQPVALTSASKTQTWFRCQRLWAMKYLYRAKVEDPLRMVVGSIFEDARCKIDAGVSVDVAMVGCKDIARIPLVERWKLQLVLDEYKKIVLPELGPHKNEQAGWYYSAAPSATSGVPMAFKIIGYLDGLQDDRSIIHEWKYADEPDSYDLHKVSLQASTYLAMVPEAKEFHLHVARRPRQEQLLKTPEDKIKYKKPPKPPKPPKGAPAGWIPEGWVTSPDGPVPQGYVPEPYSDTRSADETYEEWAARVNEALGTSTLHKRKVFLRGEFPIANEIAVHRLAYVEYSSAIRGNRIFVPNRGACQGCEYEGWCKTHPNGPCDSMACNHVRICTRVKVTSEELKYKNTPGF